LAVLAIQVIGFVDDDDAVKIILGKCQLKRKEKFLLEERGGDEKKILLY
jgi:hypothetical protein